MKDENSALGIEIMPLLPGCSMAWCRKKEATKTYSKTTFIYFLF